ncbi:cob(I)yrinic acid a,c-diamide adenosyltransferase [bacterium]|nr:cob(I)yrinic acid a,c-diamide adenosyltransferase [bacterium]
MKIYTKTGDDGTTGLFGGGRVSKDALRIESYGTVDELNSVIGIARSVKLPKELDVILLQIQNDLFNLGADLATPYDNQNSYIPRMQAVHVEKLEQSIDTIDAQLPELTSFIFPGGTTTSAYLHLARNVCRRAERLTVSLSKEENIGPMVVTYLNRLSDLLFVLARWANKFAGKDEVKWSKD